MYTTLGRPIGNGNRSNFKGKLRGDLLDGEIFYTLQEALVLIEQWRHRYNRIPPHNALDTGRSLHRRADA